jgi:hypothetical protein
LKVEPQREHWRALKPFSTITTSEAAGPQKMQSISWRGGDSRLRGLTMDAAC